MTAPVYAREYADHVTNVLSPLVGMGVQLFRTGEGGDCRTVRK
jgi:hypothetical protein